MNKKVLFAVIFCGAFASVKAQLFINNAQLFIQSGASVVVQGDVTSNQDILGDGKIVLKGTNAQSISMNGKSISNLEIDNSSNAALTSNAAIGTNLLFTNGNLQTGNHSLIFNNNATASNASNTNHIVTDGLGKVIKTALGSVAFTYEISNSTGTYNPVTISNTGSADSISVRCLATANTNGINGSAFTKEVVNASWDISEAVAGGSNLSITASWDGPDELTGFNRSKSGISNYITSPAQNIGWDLLNNQITPATGSGPYSYTRSNISTLGAFAIGSRPILSPLLLSAKIFLQGCYSGNDIMLDNLRTLDMIPVTEPYTSMTGFTHSGSGGEETTTSSIAGSVASAGNNAIVDWVFVQLHQASDSQVVSTRSALLQRDGDIVDVDGLSPLNLAGNLAGDYFISVKHRNHLGVRSNSTITLNKTVAGSYDFTSNLSNSFRGTVSNDPLALLSGNKYGLWAGNTNDDNIISMTGLYLSSNDYLKLMNAFSSTQPPTYSKQDINMDGAITISSSANSDYDMLYLTLPNNTITISEPSF